MARTAALNFQLQSGHPLVFYEAPHRILETLADIGDLMPHRAVVLAREMTKLHEEYLRGTALEILETLANRSAIKGEMTIVIGKPAGSEAETTRARELLDEYLAQGLSRMDAIKEIARVRGVPKREVYAELELSTPGEAGRSGIPRLG